MCIYVNMCKLNMCIYVKMCIYVNMCMLICISRIYLKVINPGQVPLTEPYFNLQQVTYIKT